MSGRPANACVPPPRRASDGQGGEHLGGRQQRVHLTDRASPFRSSISKAVSSMRARRGRRADYAPLQSPLVEGCEPITVAQARCAVCRAPTVYVADLGPLAGGPMNETIRTGLASIPEPWVAAGATTPDRAAALQRAGGSPGTVSARSRPARPLGSGACSTPAAPRSCSASTCAPVG
jgi:hypothetical protein